MGRFKEASRIKGIPPHKSQRRIGSEIYSTTALPEGWEVKFKTTNHAFAERRSALTGERLVEATWMDTSRKGQYGEAEWVWGTAGIGPIDNSKVAQKAPSTVRRSSTVN